MNKIKRAVPIELELQCYTCGETKSIPQYFTHRTNICIECRNEKQKEYQAKYRSERDPGERGRNEYPLNGMWKNQKQKFGKLRSELSALYNREEWKTLLRSRLEGLEGDKELMRWINKHQSNEPNPIPGGIKRGTKRGPKSKTEYPDTRNAEF